MTATDLVRKALETRPGEEQESLIDDSSIDVSMMGLKPGEDVMADFGGFLEKRKKDRGMERNTMMSQIDGLVSNLDSDINQMLMTKESTRRKMNKESMLRQQREMEQLEKRKLRAEKEAMLRLEAEKKENMLKEDLTQFVDDADSEL